MASKIENLCNPNIPPSPLFHNSNEAPYMEVQIQINADQCGFPKSRLSTQHDTNPDLHLCCMLLVQPNALAERLLQHPRAQSYLFNFFFNFLEILVSQESSYFLITHSKFYS